MQGGMALQDRDALNERLAALDTLNRNEGWKLFQAQCDLMEQAAYNTMVNAPNAHEMAKHTGAYKVIRDMRSWAEREATLIRGFLTESK